MAVTPEQWRAEMGIANYDQAWSMVHFLVHGDGGRYQPAFAKCVRELSPGRSADGAWRDAVGSDGRVRGPVEGVLAGPAAAAPRTSCTPGRPWPR